MAYYLGSTYDLQSRKSQLSNSQGTLDQPLPILLGQDAVNPGTNSLVVPHVYLTRLRSKDYTFDASFFAGLIGQDSTNPGSQLLLLPPNGVSRSKDYSYTQTGFVGLLGALALNPGLQLLELPPKSAVRGKDYTFTQSFFNGLIGADATNPGIQTLNLPVRVVVRSKDYTYLTSTFPALIGTDSLVSGLQLSGNAPNGRLRAISLSETGTNLVLFLNSVAPTFPNGLSNLLTDLPPKGLIRSRDYSITSSYLLTLIGQDIIYGGIGQSPQIDWSNPRRVRPLTQSVFETGVNALPLLTFVVATPIVGVQLYDLPIRLIPRLTNNGQTSGYTLELIGADLLPNGPGGEVQRDWTNPVLGRRLRDYTYIQTQPLHIYQQIPNGQSLDLTTKFVPSPARLRDYTHLNSLRIQLIGQDRIYAGNGQVPIYEWLNPRGRQRSSSLLILDAVDTLTLSSIIQRDIDFNVGQPYLAWSAGVPYLVWLVGAPKQ